MKKLVAVLIVLLLLFGGAFLWLLGKAGPENANTETITIEVEDNFER